MMRRMTSEEAKERICDILEEATSGSEAVCYVTSDDEEALKMAINALTLKPKRGKMISKKIGTTIFGDAYYTWACDQCGENVKSWDKYCPNCGAKL